ncbi:MAG: hypothetical protein AAF773_04365 [Cyanobacteria bacterium P01_D01_bin.115]
MPTSTMGCVMELSRNYEKAGAYQAFQFRRSYQQQQGVVLAAIVVASVVSSALCSPELTYLAIIGTYVLVTYGDSLTEKLEMTRRRTEDYEAVSDEAFTQIAYTDMMRTETPTEVADIEVPLSDAGKYLSAVAQNWRSHLALLSPTDTGKSSVLLFLLNLLGRQQDLMVLAIEPKGGQYPGLQDDNIIRVSFRPSLDEAKQLCRLLQAIVDEAQDYANGTSDRTCRILLIIEEWLSIHTTLASNPATRAVAAEFKSLITSLAVVGRGCRVQLVLVAQSAIAEDLGLSSGIRSNFRFLALGSRFGGFEGVENTFANPRLMPESRRDDCKLQLKTAVKQLQSNRHPLVLTNLLGSFEIFPMMFMNEQELSTLQVNSRPIDARFVDVLGQPTNYPDPLTTDFVDRPQPDVADRPALPAIANNKAASEPLSLSEVEDLIMAFLSGKPEEFYKASVIKASIRTLKEKSVPLETVEKICTGLESIGKLESVDTDGKPRYRLK